MSSVIHFPLLLFACWFVFCLLRFVFIIFLGFYLCFLFFVCMFAFLFVWFYFIFALGFVCLGYFLSYHVAWGGISVLRLGIGPEPLWWED